MGRLARGLLGPGIMAVPYRETEDAALVRLAQNGDTRAFDELVRRYQDKVYRLAFKILRHEDDAAEALQDAFISAFRGLKQFKAESTFSTWLYRVALNTSLMRYRRRRNDHVSLDQPHGRNEEAKPLQLTDGAARPPDVVLVAETREAIEEGIQRLPDVHRDVVVLRDVEGLSNAQVCQRLGLPLPAVKSRLHRGRLFLREWLTRYFQDEDPLGPLRRGPRAVRGLAKPAEQSA